MTKITSAEVAARAGVSQSAVSRVFTPGASASKKTIEKVRKAAGELGYRPNSLARAMVSGKSRIIGLVVAYLENHFYPEALEKLSSALQERGYHVLIFMASRTAEDVDDVVEEILDYQVDGIITASVAMSSELTARCRNAGVPMVLFNRSQDGPGLSSVASDNVAGGRKVADFLLTGGHERIAYVAGWEGASTQRDREAGFAARLAEAGVSSTRGRLGGISTSKRPVMRRVVCSRWTRRPTRFSWPMTTWLLRSWMWPDPSSGSRCPVMSPSSAMTMCRLPGGLPTT